MKAIVKCMLLSVLHLLPALPALAAEVHVAVLLTRGKDNPAAKAFLTFLKGLESRKVILTYGYEL